MKIGVVGAGAWGKNIVNTLHGLGLLGGISEVSAERRAELRAQFDVPVVGDPDELVELALDGVCIAAPAPVHHPLAKMFLLEGTNVFVEKPMTLNSQEAEELVWLAKDNKRVLMVGHLLLYQPAVHFIKQYLAEGNLGKVHSLHHERLNLGRVRKVENVLWSLGVHDVAVSLYLAGEAPVDIAFSGTCSCQPDIEDDTHTTLTYPSGVVAHIHNSWLWPETRRRLTVVGSAGMLVYCESTQTVTHFDKRINNDLTNHVGEESVIFEGAGQPLLLEMEHFAACCESGQNALSDGQSGLEVVQVLERACASDLPTAMSHAAPY